MRMDGLTMVYDVEAFGNIPASENWLFDAATQEWKKLDL